MIHTKSKVEITKSIIVPRACKRNLFFTPFLMDFIAFIVSIAVLYIISISTVLLYE